MQHGSMQGLGSSLELARPRGEGGLQRQDRLPFPEHPAPCRARGCCAMARPGCTRNGRRDAGRVGELLPGSWGTSPQLRGRWGTHPWRHWEGSHLNTKSNGCWGRSGEHSRKSTGREDVR